MKCFLISPIGEDGSEIRRDADKVKNHLLRPVMPQSMIDEKFGKDK